MNDETTKVEDIDADKVDQPDDVEHDDHDDHDDAEPEAVCAECFPDGKPEGALTVGCEHTTP